ncbi:MAG: 30S ribosomal protein S6 [Desulfuromonadales bacterium]|nr:30S ribosomal protein S6 [Desulfuromonadales bacterium]
MRTYETIFIVHPEVVGDDLTAHIDKYRQVLVDQGAEVFKADNWGTRTLAYPVKKQNRGSYIYVIFDAEPSIIAEFERRMRIDEKVIKFQTVLLEGGYQVPEVPEAASEETAADDAEETASAAAGEDESDA